MLIKSCEGHPSSARQLDGSGTVCGVEGAWTFWLWPKLAIFSEVVTCVRVLLVHLEWCRTACPN